MTRYISILLLPLLLISCDLSKPLYSLTSTASSTTQPSLISTIPIQTTTKIATTTPVISTFFSPTPIRALENNILPSSTFFVSITSTPTFMPTFNWSTCNAVYVSRLVVGDSAYVSYYPPFANNVREAPYKSSKLLGKIKPGDEIIIIEGPSCSNGWIWWKITAHNDTLVGWTSEGDDNGYWLVPIK